MRSGSPSQFDQVTASCRAARIALCAIDDASWNAGVHLRDVVEGSMTGATGWATGAAARAIRQSIVQDALDGTGAATALHTAAKASVDLVRGQRLWSSSCHHVPYLVVA
jgi:hypothetical protein